MNEFPHFQNWYEIGQLLGEVEGGDVDDEEELTQVGDCYDSEFPGRLEEVNIVGGFVP